MQQTIAVDESVSARTSGQHALDSAGRDVVLAGRGIEALDYPKQNTVDLVLTNSSESRTDKKVAGKAVGATDGIFKPVDRQQPTTTLGKMYQ